MTFPLSAQYMENCDGGLVLRQMEYGQLIFRKNESAVVKYRIDEKTGWGYVWHAEGYPYWHPILRLHRGPFTLVMNNGRKLKVFLKTLDGLMQNERRG